MARILTFGRLARVIAEMAYKPSPPVLADVICDEEVAKRNRARIHRVPGGFFIERKPCPVCGEPPFGDEYCCGHVESDIERARR